MSREVHVRFCEGRGVQLPPATLLKGHDQASGSVQKSAMRE
jgi:hypothetical protein